MGVNAHVRESGEANGNRIPVRIRVDVATLPDLPVFAFRGGRWQPVPLSRVTTTDGAVFWPGALPLFQCRSLTVSTTEQQARLLSIGKRVSNVEVPEVGVDCLERDLAPPDPPADVGTGLVIPESQDRVRGALSMAIWAVPRIGPWLDVLTESLACRSERLRERAVDVDASWWRFPPWVEIRNAEPAGAQERLWLAALTVFGGAESVRPDEATDRIAAAAVEGAASEVKRAIASWGRATREVLHSGQRRVQHYGWRYDYSSRQVDPSMRIGPLPEWARTIGERLVEAGYFREHPPDQVIVNEYCGKQGISRHIDSPSSFTGVVAMISLVESWEMIFRKRGSKTKVAAMLERRSATVLEGDARYRWTHEIPKRNNEPGFVKPGKKRPSRVPRGRRVSLTFRKTNAATTEHPSVTGISAYRASRDG